MVVTVGFTRNWGGSAQTGTWVKAVPAATIPAQIALVNCADVFLGAHGSREIDATGTATSPSNRRRLGPGRSKLC